MQIETECDNALIEVYEFCVEKLTELKDKLNAINDEMKHCKEGLKELRISQ